MDGFEGKVQFVWQVADLLRGDYKPAEYRGVILPLLVLRRLDAVLEETKPKILARAEQLTGVTDNPDLLLRQAAGVPFYNVSPLTFSKLLDSPNNLADPNLLYNLQTRIENHHVIDPEEQQKAVTAFLLGNSATHATVSANVDPAVLRAGNLPEHELTDLRDALKAFTRAYAFLGQVMKFTDEELESLYLYGKLLLAKLKESPTESGSIDLADTALAFIGHQAGLETSGSNSPGESSGEIESFTGEGRGGTVEEALMVKLSELISTFNAAHGIDLSQAGSLLIYVGVPSHLSDDEDVQQRAADNTEEQFSLTIKKDDIAGALFDNQESSNKLLKALLENESFAETVQKIISAETWKAARRKHEGRAA